MKRARSKPCNAPNPCCPWRHQEYLHFLKQIDTSVPKGLTIHLIVDNYATHKHPRMQRWLVAHPRVRVHFTPTYASWLNQVEIWSHIITQKAIRRGTFGSVKELVAKSITSSEPTMPKPARSSGPLPPIPSSKRSGEFVNIFLGHNTSNPVKMSPASTFD